MIEKNIIIINDNKFYRPLVESLKNKKFIIKNNLWHIDKEMSNKYFACFIPFNYAIKHPIKSYLLKSSLKKHKIPLVTWNRDAPHYLNAKKWKLWLLDRAKIFDIYMSHSLVDKRFKFADEVCYLANAANTDAYNLGDDEQYELSKLRNKEQYKYDVSFFGGADGDTYKEDKRRQSFLNALEKKLQQDNIKYKIVDTSTSPLPIDDQIKLIKTSRINLSYDSRCEYGFNSPSGLPERFFGIPACGGFLLGDRRSYTKDVYAEDEYIGEFSTSSFLTYHNVFSKF